MSDIDGAAAAAAQVELAVAASQQTQSTVDVVHSDITSLRVRGQRSSSAAAVPAHFLTPGATTRVTSLSGLRRRHAANTLVMPSTPDAALTTRTRAYSEPAFVQDYRPVPDHLLDAHHEAESTFSAGIIRYEQHGKGATRGGAAAFKKRNRGSCLVDTLHIHELLGAEVWRATLVEFVGTFFFVFLHIAFVMAAVKHGFPSGTFDPPKPGSNATATASALTNEPLAVPIYVIAIFTPVLAVLLIWIMAPVSGGHFNTFVSVSTALNGLMKPVRAAMYVVAQFLGALCGAAVINYVAGGMENPLVEATGLGGCSFGDMPAGRAFVAELTVATFLLWAFYGLAFDPQQFQVFGPVLAPIVLVLVIMFAILTSAAVMPGLGFNIVRCAAPAIVSGKHLDQLWIYIVADLTAAVIHAGYYRLVPPQHVVELEEHLEDTGAGKRDDDDDGGGVGAGAGEGAGAQ